MASGPQMRSLPAESGARSTFAERALFLCTNGPVYGRLTALYRMVASLCAGLGPAQSGAHRNRMRESIPWLYELGRRTLSHQL
jgi:hypothetical protein